MKCDLPAAELDELVRLHEEMELEFRPDLAVGVAEALQNLHGNYRMGVISDAIFSPGRALMTEIKESTGEDVPGKWYTGQSNP